MKKDIPDLRVEELAIAIVPREDSDEELWDTYIINFRDTAIDNVLISSRGYGEINSEKMKTTTLRHYFEQIDAESIQTIEPIQISLFELTNEYWVSFNYEGHMYDKKYVFVKGSIADYNFTRIPFLNKMGVMIK